MNDGKFDEAEGMGDGNTGECEEVLSDYAPSDELCSLVDSDMEDEGPRAALREHCIKEGCDFRFKKNESTRVTAICKFECGWRIHAYKKGDTSFQITSLDACHLKGHFGGQLLHAIARDGNDRMYPVAMAVVESECKDS
ncbi:hypothetical protein L1049_022183 [Liquidambar formosana]|uniref:Transposase MuDR plant domain-containing protein n=1 Tax=Liquidambar formosana TaxID=63359 RepID=A0AAP0WQP5_LIQFO